MRHRLLGEITTIDDGQKSASVVYDNRKIDICLFCDDTSAEDFIAIAVSIVERLNELDEFGRKVIVRDLRQTYNDDWREYDEWMPDRTLKRTSNPELSESEFASKFQLCSIVLFDEDEIDLDYGKSGLFGGHTVFVRSRSGSNFSGAKAGFEG